MEMLKKSFAAGLMISIGATVFLATDSKIAGAILFSVGLFAICSFGMFLFTGKIGYCFSNKNKPNVILIWLGNFLGAIVCCGLIRLAKPAYAEKALEMVNKKLDMNLGLVFILAIFCGILMYAAVENFRRHPNDISGIFGIVFCVAVFILAGFEHSIADMCYCVFAVNSVTMGLRILLFLVVVTAGNAVGAWAIRWLTEIAEKKKNA